VAGAAHSVRFEEQHTEQHSVGSLALVAEGPAHKVSQHRIDARCQPEPGWLVWVASVDVTGQKGRVPVSLDGSPVGSAGLARLRDRGWGYSAPGPYSTFGPRVAAEIRTTMPRC
jgi:hypothetical protein